MATRSGSRPLSITDGRVARSHRTRRAIVDALLELLKSGDLRPTTERIAAAAGVSTRSIFLHFADVDTLFTEAVDRFRERNLDSEPPVPATGPLAGRIEAFVQQRARRNESMGSVVLAAQLQEPFSEGLRQRLRAGRGRSRKLIEATFAPELDSLSPEARRDLLEALTVVSSWSSWDGLRRYQGLSRVRAQRVFQRTFAALLGAPGR